MTTLTPPVDCVAASFERCTPLFFALGETARQQILLLLTEHGTLNVGQLAELLPLSRPAISHHLKVLRQAGLVAVHPVGTENRYSPTFHEGVNQIERFLAEVRQCCG